MQTVSSPTGVRVSYEKYGKGPPLVLVHGAFSDHLTNWEFVKPLLEARFTVYAVARRGRGLTDATTGHSLDEESVDVATLIRAIEQPVFLLGHSHGAHVALGAAARAPSSVRKLVLYEPPKPWLLANGALARLESFAHTQDWDGFAAAFFNEGLRVPMHEIESLRATALWAPILADAPATLHDFRALSRYEFSVQRFKQVNRPVLLQVGSESPRELYVTDALAAALPDVRIDTLAGQAHEGMTTAPELYEAIVSRFLLS